MINEVIKIIKILKSDLISPRAKPEGTRGSRNKPYRTMIAPWLSLSKYDAAHIGDSLL